MRLIISLLSIFAVSLVLSACTQDFPTLSCVSDDDCDAPQVCREFACVDDPGGDTGDDTDGDVSIDSDADDDAVDTDAADTDASESDVADAADTGDVPDDADGSDTSDVMDVGVDTVADADVSDTADTSDVMDVGVDTVADADVSDTADTSDVSDTADTSDVMDVGVDTVADAEVGVDTDTGSACPGGAAELECGCPLDCDYRTAVNAELITGPGDLATWFDIESTPSSVDLTVAPSDMAGIDESIQLVAPAGQTVEATLVRRFDGTMGPVFVTDLALIASAALGDGGSASIEVLYANREGMTMPRLSMTADESQSILETMPPMGTRLTESIPQFVNPNGVIVRLAVEEIPEMDGVFRLWWWAADVSEPPLSSPNVTGTDFGVGDVAGFTLQVTGGTTSSSTLELGALAQRRIDGPPTDSVLGFFPPQMMFPQP